MAVRRRTIVIFASVLAMSMMGWAQASPIAPVRIIGGTTDQFLPSANANWVGWSNNSLGQPGHYDAFVRPMSGGVPTGTTSKLNAAGTSGWAPDLQSDANEVALQQVNRAGTQSTIYTVDLDSLPFTRVAPVGLNSSDWEWQPSISASWILYGRQTRTHSGIFLYNRMTHHITTLTNPPYSRTGSTLVYPDDVTETYATWTSCGPTACNVHYYTIGSGLSREVPNPSKRFFYASSVSDATGDIYFTRSLKGCGAQARIFRWHIGDPTFTVVSVLPNGFDAPYKTSTFNDGTHDTVTFERMKCGGKYYGDIFQVRAAETAT